MPKKASSRRPAVWRVVPITTTQVIGYAVLRNGKQVDKRTKYIAAAARALILKSQEAQ